MNTALIDTIDALLPQTQCGKCGHDGCLPYAQGIADGEAINKCPPGGQATVTALATLLARPELPLAEAPVPAQVAVIREAECIGCTKCIQACPLDAIVGAAKLMHTVIADECSGCELCVAPCPVDCIDLLVLEGAEAEAQRARAAQFRQRHRARQRRLARNAARRREERQAQPRAAVAQNNEPAPQTDALKKARIAASMARVALGKAERQLALHGTEALQQQVERLRTAHQEADEALRHIEAQAPSAAQASDAGADRKRATIAAALARSQLAKAQRAFGATPDEHQRNQLQELEAAVARAEQALAAPTDGEARLRQAKQAYKAARDALRNGEREAREDLPALRDALARTEQALHLAEEHCGKPAPQLQRQDKRPVSPERRQAKTTLAYARAELARLRRDGAAAEALSAAEQRLEQAQREVDALERPA